MIHINTKEKVLVDSETGEIIRPSCYDYLVQYHAYLRSRNHHSAAQAVLAEVFKGEKVITKMIENSQKHLGFIIKP